MYIYYIDIIYIIYILYIIYIYYTYYIYFIYIIYFTYIIYIYIYLLYTLFVISFVHHFYIIFYTILNIVVKHFLLHLYIFKNAERRFEKKTVVPDLGGHFGYNRLSFWAGRWSLKIDYFFWKKYFPKCFFGPIHSFQGLRSVLCFYYFFMFFHNSPDPTPFFQKTTKKTDFKGLTALRGLTALWGLRGHIKFPEYQIYNSSLCYRLKNPMLLYSIFKSRRDSASPAMSSKKGCNLHTKQAGPAPYGRNNNCFARVQDICWERFEIAWCNILYDMIIHLLNDVIRYDTDCDICSDMIWYDKIRYDYYNMIWY